MLADVVATFKDNPGRRLISIYVGAVFGLLVSGMLSLDLFAAALQRPTATIGPSWLPHLGIVLTGLVMGLGSNPTHEVIRAVQEFKKSLKT
jgi:hypothetical protein